MGNLMNTYEDAIPVAFPPQTPLIIGFDNINIYKGHARFARLQKSMAPIMWNLTVRMARKPNVNTASKPQKDVLSLTVEDIFLGKREKKLEENSFK